MTDDDATIHLRVPAALKARWVRESRAAGRRLTDWIIERVEAKMHQTILIPADLAFADLRLARNPDGAVSFDSAIVERVALASGLPADYFMVRPEDAVAELIVNWYAKHRAAGGEADPVADDLIAETRVEDERGGGLSHQPGRA